MTRPKSQKVQQKQQQQQMRQQRRTPLFLVLLLMWFTVLTSAWISSTTTTTHGRALTRQRRATLFLSSSSVSSSSTSSSAPKLNFDDDDKEDAAAAAESVVAWDYKVPENAVIEIQPQAMRRLRELRIQQNNKDNSSMDAPLLLRMGVRSGGCSGLSYVMDFCTMDDIHETAAADNDENDGDGGDVIDKYMPDNIWCVVDSKSMLYLYGLQLNYSTKLVGGGFQFINPNAEESCGCGSSFGV